MAQNDRCPDPVDREAGQLANMLDRGNLTHEVANRLREDAHIFSPAIFNRLLRETQALEQKGRGDDLHIAPNGDIIIGKPVYRDNDSRRFPPPSRGGASITIELESRIYDDPSHRRDGQSLQADRNNTAEDALLGLAFGGVIGAAVDGRKGAAAGAAAGVITGVIVGSDRDNRRK